MKDIPSISDLADTLSLKLRSEGDTTLVSRHGFSVQLPEATLSRIAKPTAAGRHLAYGVLFGCRLAIDRRACDFDLRQERPEKPGKVFHAHEVPSVYGERLPRLVPALATRWFEALSGCRALTTSWHVDGLVFVYLLETGKFLHTLCEGDLDNMELGRERLIRDARHALFYDSYKLRPRDEERVEAGRVRIFRTSEGLGASRAMLLPDFDYDAAREHGCFSTPSRDMMIIGRPESAEHSETIWRRVTELTAEKVASEPFPLSSTVFRLRPDEVLVGEHAGSDVLPPHAVDDDGSDEIEPPQNLDLRDVGESQ